MTLSHFVPTYLLNYITSHPTKHPQMFMIYLHTKFKIAHCNQQLVIATKQMSNYNNDTLHAIMNNANEQLIILFCPSEASTSNLNSETSNLIQIVQCFPLSVLHYRMITEQWTVMTCTELKVPAWHLSGRTKRKPQTTSAQLPISGQGTSRVQVRSTTLAPTCSIINLLKHYFILHCLP